MSFDANTLRKLAALNLSADQMSGVVDILADMQAAEEARKLAQRERARKSRASRDRNVTATLATRDVPRERVTRAEDKPLTSVIEPQEKKDSKVRACRLPTDFAPDVSWAVSQGLTPSQADTEAAKFRDYWSAKGANATKTDWPATWRNWVRSALERQPTARGSPQTAISQADVFAMIAKAPSHEDQPGPPEDRSSLRPAIPYLSAVRSG